MAVRELNKYLRNLLRSRSTCSLPMLSSVIGGGGGEAGEAGGVAVARFALWEGLNMLSRLVLGLPLLLSPFVDVSCVDQG